MYSYNVSHQFGYNHICGWWLWTSVNCFYLCCRFLYVFVCVFSLVMCLVISSQCCATAGQQAHLWNSLPTKL